MSPDDNQERELERAFLAGWNAHETGLDSAADGPALGFRMFLRGHNFGDEERGEDLTILAHRSGADGWRLVPIEPTPQMFSAAFHAVTTRTLAIATGGVMLDLLAQEDQHKVKARLRWNAMLSAAPSPSTHGEG